MTDDTDDETEIETTNSALTLSRTFDAPPERVYEAFVDPEEFAAWLPPEGFSGELHEFDATEGGGFRMSFNAEVEELEPYASTFSGTYEELIPGERIVYTEAFESDDPGMAGEMTTTVTLEAVPDGTAVTVEQAGMPETISPEDSSQGWTDSLDNLAAIVEAA